MDEVHLPTHLVVCGFSHATAPLELRERHQLAKNDVPAALQAAVKPNHVQGVVAVSTCNRMEFYFETREPEKIVALVLDLVGGTGNAELKEALYTKVDTSSARHLMRVCAGLDSVVLGENQILGQVKDAYSLACRERVASALLHRVFHEAFRASKAVRSSTEIAAGPTSASGVALDLLVERVGDLHGCKVLIVGVSPMTEIAAEKLQRLGAELVVTNRTAERARRLAKLVDAQVVPFEELSAAMRGVDIVFSCTGAGGSIMTAAQLRAVVDRRERELFLVDLAVPRDFEPLADNHVKLFVVDMDDLGARQRQVMHEREKACVESGPLIEERVSAFGKWLRVHMLAPRVQAAVDEAERLFAGDLELAARRHSPEEMRALEGFGRIVLRHTLDATLRILRETPDDVGGADILEQSEETRRENPPVCRSLRSAGPRES